MCARSIRAELHRETSMRTWLAGVGLAVAIASLGLPSTRADAACGREGVYVYETSWCPYCNRLRQMLVRNHINYTGYDIDKDRRAFSFMKEHYKTTAIPVIVIDGSYVVGFNESRIRQLLCIR